MSFSLIFLIELLSSFFGVFSVAYNCRRSDSEEKAYNDAIVLCLHFVEQGQKMMYSIKVDDYSVIKVKDVYRSINPTAGLRESQHIVAQIGDYYTNFSTVRN